MVFWYISARDVMERLDDVFGVGGWKDSYETAFDKKLVVCRLSCKIDGEWVTKEDVGGESEQPDEDDRHKSAFSSALKRAAVKFGVGRYLYNAPKTPHLLSERGKFFDRNNMPRLPPQFLPGPDDPATKSKKSADWIAAQYEAAKSADDVAKTDAVIKERNASALLLPADAFRADDARASARKRLGIA